MRDVLDEQLDSIFANLADISARVEVAVRRATQALLTGDAALAESVISGDAEIDHEREQVEDAAYLLLSLQAPVAGDLRTIVAALRMAGDLERMGDLSVHVAKVARLRVPHVAVPAPLRPVIARMATVAEDMVHRVADVVAERDVAAARELAAADEEMDALRRSTFVEMLAADWAHGVEAAVDVALLGRYYERLADHAVSVANRVVFVVTGERPGAVRA